MRVIVCGSRNWKDKGAIERRIANLPPLTEVITGGANGADFIANQAAKECGHFQIIFPANWVGQGKAAGPLRNLRMFDMEPDFVIAFRSEGDSKGTDHMIGECKRRGIPCEVVSP